MSREKEDSGSIWASRHSPEPLTDFGSAEFRRPRAGTLPSRLPSRLETSRFALDSNKEPLSHLGSLALISPDGNDILRDNFPPSSRSAVGQQPNIEKRRSPPLASIPEPAGAEESVASSRSSSSGTVSSGPLGGGALSRGSVGDDSSYLFPDTPNRLSASSNHLSGLNSANSRAARSRAGSMNSVAMRSYPFSPFGNSIWGPGPASLTSSSTGSSTASAPLAGVPSFSTAPLDMNTDPISKVSSELQKASESTRMRSYTFDGNKADSSHLLPSLIQPRNRAQTLLHPAPPQPQQIGLSRFGQQHQFIPEFEGAVRSDGFNNPVVRLGDVSQVPTQALWITNIPPQATSLSLQSLFSNFGKIETAAVIPSQRCAYVVFSSTAQAIEAKATAHGQELYLENGLSSVSFAVLDQRTGQKAGYFAQTRSPEQSPQQQPEVSSPPLPVTSSSSSPISSAYILKTLNAPTQEVNNGVAHLTRAQGRCFDAPIPQLSELVAETCEENASSERTYNATVLRDLRRKVETMMAREVEELALDMQQELPLLASDYIGNTVVQFVFERSSPEVRDMMLRRLVPVFAATGTHKNGTWAVQKMIDLARGPRQYALVEEAIRPHLVALLLDQFGNYVVQGCLKFGAPYSDFVYVGVASILAQVASNRFGARAVRALLESEHTTLANQRLVATAIVQQITSLATNANGSLLVSWLLDGFERLDPQVHLKIHSLVATQLIPQYLVPMCCSKVGSGIIVKLASSSASAQRVFDSLLEPLTDSLPLQLTDILEDPTGQGATTLYRLLSSVFPLNSLERQVTVNKVRKCLLRPKAKVPNHKRLLEECGLEMLQPICTNIPHPESPPLIAQTAVKYAH